MDEEEYFRKNYPDSCYGDKPLSPHWDFFQDGVEFGEQQSENKIAELEKENAELKECSSVICDRLLERIDETVELKNENIGLKNQLTQAEELLKDFVALDKDMDWNLQLAYDTEQFLNSEVRNDKF